MKRLVDVVKAAQKEKVVRVGLLALRNLLEDEQLVGRGWGLNTWGWTWRRGRRRWGGLVCAGPWPDAHVRAAKPTPTRKQGLAADMVEAGLPKVVAQRSLQVRRGARGPSGWEPELWVARDGQWQCGDAARTNATTLATPAPAQTQRNPEQTWGDEDIPPVLESVSEALKKGVTTMSSFDKYKKEVGALDRPRAATAWSALGA